MNDEQYLVVFRMEEDGEEIRAAARAGENLMDVARRARAPVDAPCGGNGSCGRCRVRIVRGKLQSSKSFYISDVEYEEGWRLACTSRVAGDVALGLPEL